MGSPNEEQFDAITVKLQQIYDEWSAEGCGQQTVREKIVSDFEEFVQKTIGCEGIYYAKQKHLGCKKSARPIRSHYGYISDQKL